MIHGEMCLTIMKITPQCKTILNVPKILFLLSKPFFPYLGERHKEMSMSYFTPKPSVSVMMCVMCGLWLKYVLYIELNFLWSVCERSWDRGWGSL